MPTKEGISWGLRDTWVGFGGVDKTGLTTVLAEDESGMASSWHKHYGGLARSGLVQLWVPRDRAVDQGPILTAVEHALR